VSNSALGAIAKPTAWGFFEYLQFCEDIGAAPLYVGFAGETVHFRSVKDVPMDQMGWVATNFLDAIQFANGPATSPWGKLRTEEGHPDSFNLKQVKWATKGRPGLSRLATKLFIPPSIPLPRHFLYQRFLLHPRNQMGAEPSDLEGQPLLRNPNWFMTHTNLYDDRDRTLPPVYDGEVAVTSGDNSDTHGTLLAA